MQYQLRAFALILSSAATVAAWTAASTTQTDILAAKGLINLAIYEKAGHSQANCSISQVSIRKEW
jgi:tyrosinase